MRFKSATLLLVFVFCLCSFCAAQETTGSIAGTVKDGTGAVIPNAAITVTNLEKNIVIRKVTSNGRGDYVAALLPNGHYTLTVESPGFKKFEQTNIELNVNDHQNITVVMQPGSQNEFVEVKADALHVDTQTATATGLITGTQIRELALKSRNYEELVYLMPGVTKDTGDNLYVGVSAPSGGGSTPGTNEVAFSMNGSLGYQNNWTIDGADNVDRGGNFTLLNYPSVDAISEFKVLRGNYNAEYGRAGGGEINVITNSGAAKYHGGVYEFFRNDKLDANTWLNRHTFPIIPRTPLRYNDFGWTFGGPIFIPGHYNKEKNKTFFFYSQEFRRVTESTSTTATVANAQERGLDPATGSIPTFANPICVSSNFDVNGNCVGPTTTQIGPGTPYPISPLAAAYFKDIWSHVPLPQDTVNDVLTASGRNIFNYRQEIIRVDHIFGPKFTVLGRYTNDSIPTIENGGLFNGNSIPNIAQTTTDSPGRSAVITGTMTFSPTFLNELSYAYSFGGITSKNTGLLPYAASPDIAAALNLPFPNVLQRVPNINFSVGTGFTGFGDYRDFNRNFNIFDNLTKVVGRHTLKFGASFHWYQKSENAAGNNTGTFAFSSNANTFQQEWANFLLGNVASFTQLSSDFRAEIRQKEFELYGQDEFRLRPNLTLSYGLRWSLFRQPTDDRGRATNFDAAMFNPTNAGVIGSDGNLCLVTTQPCPGGVTPNPTYDPLDGIIIGGLNSPFGRAVAQQNNLEFQPRFGIAWDPFSDGKTSVRAGFGVFVESPGVGFIENNLFQNPPFVQNITINGTSLDNPLAGTPSNNSPLSIAGAQPNWHQPYTEQWNLDIQHELAQGLLVDIGYYASKGTHLLGLRDINQPIPGSYATNPLITNNPTFIAEGQPQIDQNTATLLNLIRPFIGYGSINEYQTNFRSNYSSLQTSVQKRFHGNTMFQANYTWSKNLTNLRTDPIFTVPQDSYTPNAEYGPSRFDRRHVFNANFVYEFTWWHEQQGFLGHVLGGWEFSGIVQIESGSHLTASTTSSFDPAGVGLQGIGSLGTTSRPDQLSNPNQGAPHNSGQWFNVNAFSDVPTNVFSVGNAPIGSIQGPGQQTWDLSLFKSFKIHESLNLQFRAESFNAFNHTSFSAVDTQLGSTQYGQVTDAHAPRVVQFGLKLNF